MNKEEKSDPLLSIRSKNAVQKYRIESDLAKNKIEINLCLEKNDTKFFGGYHFRVKEKGGLPSVWVDKTKKTKMLSRKLKNMGVGDLVKHTFNKKVNRCLLGIFKNTVFSKSVTNMTYTFSIEVLSPTHARASNTTRQRTHDVIRSNINQIRACYGNWLLKDPNASGKVISKFKIAASGRVQSSKTTGITLESKPLNSCIDDKIRHWKFDKHKDGKAVLVTYPFVFSPD